MIPCPDGTGGGCSSQEGLLEGNAMSGFLPRYYPTTDQSRPLGFVAKIYISYLPSTSKDRGGISSYQTHSAGLVHP